MQGKGEGGGSVFTPRYLISNKHIEKHKKTTE
jgi:hypothetical protein